MNEYLYILKPTRVEMLVESTPEEDRIVGEHFAWLTGHSETGIVVLAGRTQTDDSMGIVVFRAESHAAAEAFKNSDPAVVGGVMTAEVFPYRVALISEKYVKERATVAAD